MKGRSLCCPAPQQYQRQATMIALSNAHTHRTPVPAAGVLVVGVLVALVWCLLDALWIKRQLTHPFAWPDPVCVAALGAFLGQSTLLCAWAAWSQKRGLLRFALTIAGLAWVSWGSSLATDGSQHTGKWLVMYATFGLLVGLPLVAVRWSSVSLDKPCMQSRRPLSARRRLRQFSLASLFSATTCVAILFAFLTWVELPKRHPLSLMTFCLAIAIYALILLAIAAPRRPNASLIFILAPLVLLLGWLLPCTGVPLTDGKAAGLLMVGQGVVVLASIAAVRTTRYRMFASGACSAEA
jgi:hypothetical protein